MTHCRDVEDLAASSPWRRRQQGPPKRWHPTTTLHGITTQKTTTWTFIASPAKTWVHYPVVCGWIWAKLSPYRKVSLNESAQAGRPGWSVPRPNHCLSAHCLYTV